jgi:hypothetical protein
VQEKDEVEKKVERILKEKDEAKKLQERIQQGHPKTI